MGDRFGELVLVLGDLHIPHRAAAIPEQFRRILIGNDQIKYVLCTGNMCTKEQFDEIRSLSPNVHVVKGDFDDFGTFPEQL